MSFSQRRLALILSVCGLVLLQHLVKAEQQDTPPQNSARIRVLPVDSAFYPTTPYVNYQGPVGGYLSGAADVISSQAQFMTSQQQAYIMREQARQAHIDTRRKGLDEYLYERAVTPTMEDERERARIENLRRSRNDPPVTEIWSGKALNDLLLAIQQQQTRNVRGPMIPLAEDVTEHINVTGGQTNASVGILRKGGKLQWPLTLRRAAYKPEREKLDQLAYAAYKQAESGAVDADTLEGMTNGADKLQRLLKENVDEISPNDYMAAKRFVNEINETIRVLQDPNVSNYVTRKWAAKGSTVGDLTQDMTRQGLRFAPAVSGDQPAYVALHSAMVAYYLPPDRAWDPMAK